MGIPFRLVINSNFDGTNVSRLMFSKFSPAFCKSGNTLDNVTPFVVKARSSNPSNCLNLSVRNI